MYRLDLSNRDQNIVAQCLVDLAVKEPGENWVGERFDGKVRFVCRVKAVIFVRGGSKGIGDLMLDACLCQEFELPSTWIKEVPKKGYLEVHYHTDHISDETLKSRSRRGDNFEVRLKWFKRTLCYTDGTYVYLSMTPCRKLYVS